MFCTCALPKAEGGEPRGLVAMVRVVVVEEGDSGRFLFAAMPLPNSHMAAAFAAPQLPPRGARAAARACLHAPQVRSFRRFCEATCGCRGGGTRPPGRKAPSSGRLRKRCVPSCGQLRDRHAPSGAAATQTQWGDAGGHVTAAPPTRRRRSPQSFSETPAFNGRSRPARWNGCN
jgi:hypothetical protein